MTKKNSITRKLLLQTTHPKIYAKLMDELSTFHIHAYDIQATCQEKDNQLEITIGFGDGYTQQLSKTFPQSNLNEKNDDFANFCKEVGKTCKEALIADYFKMVKP